MACAAVATVAVNHIVTLSYTVPLLKIKDYLSKSLTCSDFRGISISGVISKVFEYCHCQNLTLILLQICANLDSRKTWDVVTQYIRFVR
jgi:hypothetical protein